MKVDSFTKAYLTVINEINEQNSLTQYTVDKNIMV